MAAGAAGAARLVLNHSAAMEGLVPVLRRLAEAAPGRIRTIVPGRLSGSRGRAQGLGLRVGVPVSGGWKMTARRGRQAQEVFVVTDLRKNELQAVVTQLVTKYG